MYSTIVLLLALGYAGVLAQLETTTNVPISTKFDSTFKVNFEVTGYKMGETPLTSCDIRTTSAACVAEKKVTYNLELLVINVDPNHKQIIFKPASGQEKRYTLTADETSSSNIKVNAQKINETKLDVGFIVKEAHLLKIDENEPVTLTVGANCDINAGTSNCVENKPTAKIYFKTTKPEENTLVCKPESGSKIFVEEMKFQTSGQDNIFAKESVNIGFVPHECKVHKGAVDAKKIIKANYKEGDYFYSTASSEVTVKSNPISEDLAISLDGSDISHKVTFKPKECAGFLASFSAFGLIAAYWIAMMEL